MVTSGTSLHTSSLPLVIRGMINEYVRNARNVPPLPRQRVGRRADVSRFWLKKNSISWKCIPSNQYIIGGTKHWLSYMSVKAIWWRWGRDGMCCCVQWGILHVLNLQRVYPDHMVGISELHDTTWISYDSTYSPLQIRKPYVANVETITLSV